jgi:hypothetical protein
MSVRPRSRVPLSNGPNCIDGAKVVDRYLRVLDGVDPVGRLRFLALERDFVAVAKRFGRRRGISYEAWRDVGVPESVLWRADIGLEILA